MCLKHLFHGNYRGLSRGVVHDFHFRESCSLVDYHGISSPDGFGPQKSAATFSHGLLGVSVICNGDICFCNTVAWHGRHLLHLASIFLSMFGNHTLLRRNCLLFTIPKCPSWHISTTSSCNFGGITIWVTLMTTSSTTLS